ncbi:hypothetical protein LUZ60_009071 [Juncus effusus]|nr:hypothetical protein LUZ60_009071 [Juncus effusus]
MTNPDYRYDLLNLKAMTRLAIDRSRGRLEEFWIDEFCDDDLLHYICDRTSVLKSLRLIACDKVSEEGIVETAKRQPLLEELEVPIGYFSREVVDYYDNEESYNAVAFGIAKTMHQLRYLQLVGIKAILEGCPHLETLDIRRCYNVKMDSDMWSRCGKLTTLRLPDNSLDDYEYVAEESQDNDTDSDDYALKAKMMTLNMFIHLILVTMMTVTFIQILMAVNGDLSFGFHILSLHERLRVSLFVYVDGLA